MESNIEYSNQNINTSFGKYYVYVHRKKSNNKVFYVGKGCRSRITSKNSRNNYWHNIVNKYGYTVEKVIENIPNEDALELEMLLIATIGREDLCNLTDGGDGSVGYIPTKETRQKLSIISKNRVWTDEMRKNVALAGKRRRGYKKSREEIEKRTKKMIGFKHSEKTKKLLSKIRKGVKHSEKWNKNISLNSGRAREIICIETQIIYKSCSEAARMLGNINKRKCINDNCIGRQKSAYGFHWKYTL